MNNFQTDFRLALKNGASLADLIGLVERYKAQGMTQHAAYAALESIRKKLGNTRDENPVCEILEAVMDRVWGYCSKTNEIWETSLSQATDR